jgi:hypothetical protein
MKAVRPDGTECVPGEIGELVGHVVTGGTELEYRGNKAASEAKTRKGSKQANRVSARVPVLPSLQECVPAALPSPGSGHHARI